MNYKLIEPVNKNKNLTAVERVLTNRGLLLEDIEHYLNVSDEDILGLNQIDNLLEGVKMLLPHIYQEDDMMVQVDSDADGYCSAAIFINYLNSIFPGYVQNHIYYQLHEEKIHGIDIEGITDNIKIVVVPDASSNEEDKHKILKEKGVDVLVIDHHIADSVSKYACVINNQLCDYPNKSLCGTAMVYKFCCFLDQILNEDKANNFLDLTALALIADMMDLREFETHRLVEVGLKQLYNPFFKALANKQSFKLKDNMNPFGIGWYIAPLINAVTRVGDYNEKLTVFESMLHFKAYEQILSTKRGAKKGQTEPRVEQAVRLCGNIKNRQERIKEENTEIIIELIEEQNLLDNKILAIRLDKDHAINRGLTGLIANQIANRFQKPTLLLNYVEEEDGIHWMGSGRNFNFSPIDDLRETLLNTHLPEFVEGHPNAFGFSILDKNFDLFMNTINNNLANIDFDTFYPVDIIYHGTDIKNEDIFKLAELKDIWGQEIKEPYIALENIALTPEKIDLLGKDRKTIKFNLPNNLSIITFEGSEEEYFQLLEDCKDKRFTFIGTCSINSFMGNIQPQIKLEAYESNFVF